jgi:hypothetical protein
MSPERHRRSLLAAPEGRPLALLSVGTGHPTPAAPLTLEQWKRESWRGVIQTILDATMTGSAALNEQLLQRILPEQLNSRHWRLQTALGACSSAMDDPRAENIVCLQAIADDLLTQCEQNGLLGEIAITLSE